MALDQLKYASGLVHRVSGDPRAAAVIYLPGVHGDWTAQARARDILSRNFHFVETAYPRIQNWEIDDFAHSLKELLGRLGIRSVHIVGESFGSLVGWQFGIAYPQQVRSFTLVGGFSRPPRFKVAALAAAALKNVPTSLLESAIDMYVTTKSAFGEHRELSVDGAYPATRTLAGRWATAKRMELIQNADYRSDLQAVRFPVRYIGGARDIIVPVRREIATLTSHLSPHCDFQSELISGAPHTLIASHPEQTVERIATWVRETDQALLALRQPGGTL